ncbi:peptidoglycan recognition protein 1-like [Pelobates fuscus]|uniref:peptidoglycan recognition protein 1-like n=1 Tax=Pelobates fuscus TaxID=191477 RepID=UPI002FE44CA7
MKLLVILLLAFCAITHGCPTILSKSAWGGKAAKCSSNRLPRPVKFVIIHHTAGEFCSSQSTCSAQARIAQKHHMDNQGWCDIGYNFLVGEDGQVYEGRGWANVGVHAPPYNSISIRISFIGTFTNRAPSASALNAAQSLIRCGVSGGYISSSYIVKGHRNVGSTECPGAKLYAIIKKWSNFKA